MRGPLDPAIYDTSRWPKSWWVASAPVWEEPPALDGDVETEVAIIGGGYAGLACAIRLAELGVEATMLDAGPIGWGASGRNGGIVGLSSHKLSEKHLLARHGEGEVARYKAAMLEGVDRLRATLDEAGAADMIQGDCEVVLAHSAKAFVALKAGEDRRGGGEVIAPKATSDMAQWGGVKVRPGFGIHPLRLARALADKARAAGAVVHPNSEVTVWYREGGKHRLVTREGSVLADRVVICTNGFTPDGLHPGMDGRAVPVLSNIGVTRVLTGEERARHPWLGDDPVADTKNLLVYLRLLPEGRLLFGMRGDLTGSEAGAQAMQKRLERRMAECFPGWAGVPLDHFWRGPICATVSYTPALGAMRDDPTVFHAFGWHGSGVNGAQVGGRLIAEVAAGADIATIPGPFRGRAPALPLPGFRPLYVGAALAMQRIEDMLG